MTHDSGFAPNPFHGIMTLATCKWMMREKKDPLADTNLYIAGFTSQKLCGDKVGEERLVYVMKVMEKLTYQEYYEDTRFQCKKPSNENSISKAGDNIYHLQNGKYIQDANANHDDCGDMIDDLKSQYVLLSNEFYYFGIGAIPVDNFRIRVPQLQAGHGVENNNFQSLLIYLEQNYQRNIPLNPPHKWPINEPFQQNLVLNRTQ